MHNVTTVYAHVYPNIKEILIVAADQNVYLTQTVQEIEHVSEISVKIPVPGLADKTPLVKLSIISQFVNVLLENLEIHSYNA